MATVTQCFCLHLGKKSRLLFCFRDTFDRISRQMVCFNIKLEQQSGLIFFPECTSGDYYVKNI